MALAKSWRSRENGRSRKVCCEKSATATSSTGERPAMSCCAAAFIAVESGSTLGLASITNAMLEPSLEASKCEIFCCTPSSNTRKSLSLRPRTAAPSDENTLQDTSTRLTCTRSSSPERDGGASAPMLSAPRLRRKISSPVLASRINCTSRSICTGFGSLRRVCLATCAEDAAQKSATYVTQAAAAVTRRFIVLSLCLRRRARKAPLNRGRNRESVFPPACLWPSLNLPRTSVLERRPSRVPLQRINGTFLQRAQPVREAAAPCRPNPRTARP